MPARSAGNPNHNLWNNHGTWWLHITVHDPDYTKRRIRQSLSTQDLDEARRRRDEILDQLRRDPVLRLANRPTVAVPEIPFRKTAASEAEEWRPADPTAVG